jgi:hypothetical protein
VEDRHDTEELASTLRTPIVTGQPLYPLQVPMRRESASVTAVTL